MFHMARYAAIVVMVIYPVVMSFVAIIKPGARRRAPGF